MDPLTIGAVGAGVQMLGQLFGQKEQQQYNERAQFMENVQNMKMWELNNAYNTPAAQMQRLKAAGLNPNLVYGHGAQASVSAAPPRQEQYFLERNPAESLSGLSNYQQIMNMDTENTLAKIRVETEKANARRALAEARMAEHNADMTDKQEFTSTNDPFIARAFDRARGNVTEANWLEGARENARLLDEQIKRAAEKDYSKP